MAVTFKIQFKSNFKNCACGFGTKIARSLQPPQTACTKNHSMPYCKFIASCRVAYANSASWGWMDSTVCDLFTYSCLSFPFYPLLLTRSLIFSWFLLIFLQQVHDDIAHLAGMGRNATLLVMQALPTEGSSMVFFLGMTSPVSSSFAVRWRPQPGPL